MKIGIMSDSHDNMKNIKKAIFIFKQNNVEYILHAGDLISPFCIPLFEEYKGKLHLCSGNNIGDSYLIKKFIKEFGYYYDTLGEIEIEGKLFGLYHGTNPAILDALFKSQNYDYIITGHTHHKEIKKNGKTILINPGETYGDLYGTATVAILTLKNRTVTFIDLNKENLNDTK
ncbi:MAG: metallophosphoesterase [Candidatus Heimdallarchaeaceae archaeon]